MRVLTILGIIFYSVIIVCFGLGLIAIALQIIPLTTIASFLTQLNYTSNLRVVIGLSGLLLSLISISFAQVILGRFQREKTIAFQTPSGQVTVALTAVEDLIKRLAGIIPEIRDLRPDVRATKKGIEVDLRVVLKAEANIPDLTTRLQELTCTRIQEVLGVEEKIMVKIHIAKIVTVEDKDRKKRDFDPHANVPFGGYTRI